MEARILHEIPPLTDKDFMYVAERHKTEFTYPIHHHEIFELNFVENAKGVRRIVGDSNEVISDSDLVLITSGELEHVWEQNTCTSADIHEITVQFYVNYSLEGSLFGRTPMSSVRKLLERARKGLSFPEDAIRKVYPMLSRLPEIKDSFYAMREMLTILYELSLYSNARELASSSFAKVEAKSDSRRVLKVKNHIDAHYTDDLRLAELAELAGMSPSSFSRFFKLRTGKNLNEYIIDIRLGYATRMLVDTTHSVSEICYQCGFNTLSNFNRLFKKRKGCKPTEFREKHRKMRIII